MSTIKVNNLESATGGGVAAKIASVNGGGIGTKNLIINGGMQIAQKASSQASITSSGYFNVDRFRTALNTGQVTTSQSTDVPTGEGFTNSFKVDVTGADTSLSGTNFLHIQQPIEGQNLQSLNYGTSGAKTITLSFFVKSNKTGIYCISLEKTDNTRYDFVAEYTISSANTWEKKTITIAPDSNIQASAGAIDNDNGKGFNRKFCLAAGGDRDNGVNNTWNAGTNHSTSNQVNLLDSTSNEWYVTGVQLELGAVATPFEHRPFAHELALCQRYTCKWWNHGETTNNHSRFPPGYYTTTSQGVFFMIHPVPMRATDGRSLTHNIGNIESFTGGGASNNLSIMGDGSSNMITPILVSSLSSVTANAIYACRIAQAQTNWYLIVSAEL